MSIDIHALSGAYAVDALDDIERAQFERHLAVCAACRSEVESLQEAGALLAETVLEAPPAGLRAKVLADIATVRPLPPVVADLSTRRRTSRRRFPGLVAAAAVVTALGVGGAVLQPWADDDTSQGSPSAAEQIRAAADAEHWTQDFDGGASATLWRSTSLDKAALVADGMAAAPDGKVYELWLQHGDDMVPAGFLPKGAQSSTELSGDPADADGFGISVEDEGGSTTGEPEGEVVAYVEFA